MRLKKFNEMFDSDDIKSQNEIGFLTGDIKKELSRSSRGSETIENVISKLVSFQFPFFDAFEDDIEFDTFDKSVSQDQENCWIFTTENEIATLSFGLKVNELNNYDVFFLIEDDEEHGYEYKGLDYSSLVNTIEEEYIPFLVNYEFGDLVSYKSEASISNSPSDN